MSPKASRQPRREDVLDVLRHRGIVLQCPRQVEFSGQGEASEQVYLLEEGLVTESVLSADGYQYHVSYRTAGALLGVPAVIARAPQPTSLVSQASSRVRVIPANEFRRLLRESVEMSSRIHDLQAREIQDRTFKLSGMVLCSARQRLEEFLWEILPHLSATGRGKVQLPFSDVEVTRFIGTTPQYLSGLFRELQGEGLIRRLNGWLVVPDRNRLWHRDRPEVCPFELEPNPPFSARGAAHST